MPRLNVGYEELDFDDMLATFEKKFSQCEKGRQFYDRTSPSNSPTHTHNSLLTSHFNGLEPELRTLWQELIQHILQERNKVLSPTSTHSADFSHHILSSGITKQLIRTEIRTTLSQLRDFHLLNHSEDQSPSQKTTIRSLKRLLAERTDALEALQRNHRQLDHHNRRLEDKLDTLSTLAADCRRRHIPMEAEVLELREHSESLRKERSSSEQALHRLTAEKQRFQSTIARYREELQLAHHQTESAQLEALQSRNRVIEMEKRTSEAKTSSAAVNARIKELHDIQDAMITLMKEAQNTTDVGTVRRNLADLGEKRSRLVGRIANLLTNKARHHTNDTAQHSADTPEPKPALALTASPGPNSAPLLNNPSEDRSDHSASSAETGNALHNTSEPGNKKPILDSLRKIGNELARSGTHRAQRKSILANVEKSRAAIENDSTLREVIEMKEKELERMEDELLNAKEKAASLERSLQKERHKKRLEPRSSPSVKEERAPSDSSTIKLSRRKSLFGWQAMETENEDADPASDANPFSPHEEDANTEESDHTQSEHRGEETRDSHHMQ